MYPGHHGPGARIGRVGFSIIRTGHRAEGSRILVGVQKVFDLYVSSEETMRIIRNIKLNIKIVIANNKHNNGSSLDYIHLYTGVIFKPTFLCIYFLVEEGTHRGTSAQGSPKS